MALNRNTQHSFTRPASGDLSGNQFRLVSIDSAGRAVIPGNQATPFIGVLMNKPAATDEAAEIAGVGAIVKVEANVAIAEGDQITAATQAGGFGSPSVTDEDHVIGVALSPAGGSAEMFEVQIVPRMNAKA